MSNKEQLINSLRFLSVDMVERANSGHPGLPMGAAPMAYTLWGQHLNFNPEDLTWWNRDRFILSAGHGSALLYSLLHLYGYDVTIDDLKDFRQLGSNTPGHPEYGYTDGVEASTGPLGQGIAMAVGMAIQRERLVSKYNKEDIKLFDNYIYSICGDGDLMEGIGYEALSLAGTLELDRLILLYDSNHITIEGSTDLAFTEDIEKRMTAMGWQVLKVGDGEDIDSIDKAISEGKSEKTKPTMIIITTEIGYGAKEIQNTSSAHGAPLGESNIKDMKEFFDWDLDSFEIPEEGIELAKSQLEEKKVVYNKWLELLDEYKEKYPNEYEELQSLMSGEIDEDIFDDEYFEIDNEMATRASSGIGLNRLAEKLPQIVGGSADLGPSNNTEIKSEKYFSKDNRAGRNIHFGVREHGMAAIANGMALYGGALPYVGTFLVFSDYMKGAMRLSALMGVPVTYVLTHDSIGVGEDGPTHQPVEQLAMIRTIPGMSLFRPADMTETLYGWKYAITNQDGPTSLVLTRQSVPNLEGSGEGALKGGYIVKEADGELDTIIIATGSEVHLAIEAAEKLEKEDIGTRVVSMPSLSVFEDQSKEYRESVLPSDIRKRVSVEAGSTYGWERYVGLDGKSIGINTFGTSAPGDKAFEHFNITADSIYETVKSL